MTDFIRFETLTFDVLGAHIDYCRSASAWLRPRLAREGIMPGGEEDEHAAGPRTPFTQTLHEVWCHVAASYVCGNGRPWAEVSAPRAPELGSESDPRAVTEALSLGPEALVEARPYAAVGVSVPNLVMSTTFGIDRVTGFFCRGHAAQARRPADPNSPIRLPAGSKFGMIWSIVACRMSARRSTRN